MEYIVLGLLILKEMTIYELNSAFKQGLSLIYSASYGNLQYAVKKLLKDDLITFTERVENGRNKKIYEINEEGMKAFFFWMEAEIPVNKLETVMLSKVYFLGLVEDRAKKIAIVEEMIEKAEAVEAGLLMMDEDFTKMVLPDEAMKIAKYQFKTLDYGIMAHTAGKNWLNKLLADVKKEIK